MVALVRLMGNKCTQVFSSSLLTTVSVITDIKPLCAFPLNLIAN